MDLISIEAIKKYISAPCTYVEGRRIFYEEDLDLIGSPFEGMTNGEVIQTMFPNSKTETISFNGIRLYIDDEVHTKIADFTYRWFCPNCYHWESEG